MAAFASILEIVPGSTGKWSFDIFKPDGTTAQPLTNLAQAWLTVKSDWTALDAAAELQLTFSPAAGITKATADGNRLEIEVSPAQSAVFTVGKSYLFDCRLRFADGSVSNPAALSGTLKAVRNITKANT